MAANNVSDAESLLFRLSSNPNLGHTAVMKEVFSDLLDNIDETFAKTNQLLFENKGFSKLPPPEKSFGLIFISPAENREKFEVVKSEYRAKEPLCLGKEITHIATEAIHMQAVQDYLKAHHVQGVEVLAIEALRKSGSR